MRNIEPASEENQKVSRENENEIKWLQKIHICTGRGEEFFSSNLQRKMCDTCEQACPCCGGDTVDDDTGICSTCKETVR